MRRASLSWSIRISPTAPSSSVCDTLGLDPFGVDDPRHCDDLVAAHDERPGLSGCARDLGVDEHVLDLSRAAREPIARAPPPNDKPWELGVDAPAAPAHGAAQAHRRALEPDLVLVTDRSKSLPEVDAARAWGCGEQLGERRWKGLAPVERTEEVLVCCGVQAAKEREDLVADQAALGVAVRRIDPVPEVLRAAVGLGFLAPDGEQRAHDIVVSPGPAPCGA